MSLILMIISVNISALFKVYNYHIYWLLTCVMAVCITLLFIYVVIWQLVYVKTLVKHCMKSWRHSPESDEPLPTQ